MELDGNDELTFARYMELASKTCTVQPCRTGAALFVRPGALVHVGLMTGLTLGSLKHFARHGTLVTPGGGQKSRPIRSETVLSHSFYR